MKSIEKSTQEQLDMMYIKLLQLGNEDLPEIELLRKLFSQRIRELEFQSQYETRHRLLPDNTETIRQLDKQ